MISGFFFKEKPVRTLAALAEKDRVWYASMLCKKIDCTYPHMINTLGAFERFGLISTEDAGRIKIVRLTQPGEDLAHEFEGLLRKLDRQGPTAAEETIEADEFTPAKKEKKTKKKDKTEETAEKESD